MLTEQENVIDIPLYLTCTILYFKLRNLKPSFILGTLTESTHPPTLFHNSLFATYVKR